MIGGAFRPFTAHDPAYGGQRRRDRGNVDSLMKLVAALETAGIELIADNADSHARRRGVRLLNKKSLGARALGPHVKGPFERVVDSAVTLPGELALRRRRSRG